MSGRGYLSIGDVLSVLREEFPDVTISKIRFLESQGLVEPERSPSGYRKFYPRDVERLRWVLRQQREHFLPLKVIRDRLERDGGPAGATGPGEPEAAGPGEPEAAVAVGPVVPAAAAATPPSGAVHGGDGQRAEPALAMSGAAVTSRPEGAGSGTSAGVTAAGLGPLAGAAPPGTGAAPVGHDNGDSGRAAVHGAARAGGSDRPGGLGGPRTTSAAAAARAFRELRAAAGGSSIGADAPAGDEPTASAHGGAAGGEIPAGKEAPAGGEIPAGKEAPADAAATSHEGAAATGREGAGYAGRGTGTDTGGSAPEARGRPDGIPEDAGSGPVRGSTTAPPAARSGDERDATETEPSDAGRRPGGSEASAGHRGHATAPTTGRGRGEDAPRPLAAGPGETGSGAAGSGRPGGRGRRDAPRSDNAPAGSTADPAGRPASLGSLATGASLSADELRAASGISVAELAALERFGLLRSALIAGLPCYDEDALTVARLAAQLAPFGVEPRHLRLFRNAVDRELGLAEQVITPLLRQRNPEARQRAMDTAAELARLGEALRGALLREGLRGFFGRPG